MYYSYPYSMKNETQSKYTTVIGGALVLPNFKIQ